MSASNNIDGGIQNIYGFVFPIVIIYVFNYWLLKNNNPISYLGYTNKYRQVSKNTFFLSNLPHRISGWFCLASTKV